MAKRSEVGWDRFPCFTDAATQQQLQEIFELTAGLFDEIMIDDFYCTACECAECKAARGSSSWAEYRLALMGRVSEERVLGPARATNPNVEVIIKYPQWYEELHERGYDVDVQTRLFDRTWVGTESRDMDDGRWGGCATYRPFWIMRWLGQIGGEKCGGGWYDPYGTHEDTYLEQARQTILGGAGESVLFCYPSLLRDTGPANVEALRRELPQLLDLAAWVRGETPRGIACYRPMNAPADGEQYLFDWLGMAGIPAIASHLFPEDSTAAFFSTHAQHDPTFAERAAAFVSRGKAVMTPAAAASLSAADRKHAHVFQPPSEGRGIMDLPAGEIATLRRASLEPLRIRLEGPVGVSLYLLGERKVALENFGREAAEMRLGIADAAEYRMVLALGPEGAKARREGEWLRVRLPARSLVALEL